MTTFHNDWMQSAVESSFEEMRKRSFMYLFYKMIGKIVFPKE